MKGYLIFISLLSVFLTEISCYSKNVCEDENSQFECVIVSGPKTYYSITPESLKHQTFHCQFSNWVDNDYISNYKWFLNDELIGEVNRNSKHNIHDIKFNSLNKRSTLNVDISHLHIGEYKVSCKYPNFYHPQTPIEERSANIFALGETDVFAVNENSGDDLSPDTLLKDISWNMVYDVTCNLEKENFLKNEVTKTFTNFKKYFYFNTPKCPRNLFLKSNQGKNFAVSIKAKVNVMKQNSSYFFENFQREREGIINGVAKIKVEGKEPTNSEDIKKNLEQSLSEINQLKSNSCAIAEISKTCNQNYDKCVDYGTNVTCENLCLNNACKTENNQVCYIREREAKCGCITSYVKVGSKCVKPAVFYGILGGCLGAIFLILIIVIVVICVRKKRKEPEIIRSYENIESSETRQRQEPVAKPKNEEPETSGAKLREKRREEVKETRTEEVPRSKRYDDFGGDNEDENKRKETPILVYPIVPIPLEERRRQGELDRRRADRYDKRDYDEIDDRGRGRRQDSLERVYTGEPSNRNRDDLNEGRTNKGFTPDKRKDDDSDSWIGLDEYVSSRQSGIARPQIRPRYDSSPKSLERRPIRTGSGRNISRQRYSKDWNN
ncbi:DgyrCDS3144 [Dimorphilus gyrociliatus]|uniref:DgyrCDS3144 n=1 Tax=Dimorphilus gyrociliatus TaxID=2664684 RepID=A0A7I8VCV3_9ANNE|nr:DgyrCDS3144 [Dimorphilus gyrociliatus]